MVQTFSRGRAALLGPTSTDEPVFTLEHLKPEPMTCIVCGKAAPDYEACFSDLGGGWLEKWTCEACRGVKPKTRAAAQAAPKAKAKAGAFSKVPHSLLLDPSVSNLAVRVYGVLGTYAKDQPTCYPAKSTVAAAMGCSVKNVERGIHELEALGALTVKPRAADGKKTSNVYRLLW